MEDPIRPGCGGKVGMVLVLIIVALIAGTAFLAWYRNPPDAPSPVGTANPQALPATAPESD